MACSVDQPATAEAGTGQAGPDVRVRAHQAPDVIGAKILNHQENGALIDCDIVVIEPPLPVLAAKDRLKASLKP